MILGTSSLGVSGGLGDLERGRWNSGWASIFPKRLWWVGLGDRRLLVDALALTPAAWVVGTSRLEDEAEGVGCRLNRDLVVGGGADVGVGDLERMGGDLVGGTGDLARAGEIDDKKL
jgi:hypothetical protein